MLDLQSAPNSQHVICLVAAPHASSQILPALHERFRRSATWLSHARALDIGPIETTHLSSVEAEVDKWIKHQPIDKFVLPAIGRRKRMLASDMDSTLITIECIDELADLVGRKAEISAVTERAMAGELDFSTSLIERTQCLAGTRLSDVNAICLERISYSPGATELIATMRANGAWTVLVSGGFRTFTRYVSEHLGMDIDFGNELLVTSGRLSGGVETPIFDPLGKQRVLLEQCEALGITPQDAIVVGDGANDAPMIELAGIGVAYHAKPKLREITNFRIDHTDLRSLLYLQGYSDDTIIER